MDQLLKSCHGSPSLQQFIESYLKMVEKLLEDNDPHLEVCHCTIVPSVFITVRAGPRKMRPGSRKRGPMSSPLLLYYIV